ncbi:uncharacterized protein LDX57_013045 [Aspergillus melleus]|uniref:uncharacterized protein n=1 Tax=Aspergillus melleus TaxID=138277 RepID=UPI001E8CE9F6|nr:uncharacterized protein LDX57_013045 [Aspergillus melleus]KAH8435415.1 hypothetical protein LDX57_013045 [Aspergillus melleus]
MSLFNILDPIQIEHLSRSAAINSTSVEVQTLPHDYREISRYLGGLPAMPSPLPGSSPENPIDVDTPGDEASDTVSCHDLHHPGDSVENPVDVDAVPVVTSDATGIIERSSPSPTSTGYMSDDRPLKGQYVCKICYDNAVDLVLGCGHAYCYGCFSKFFHDSVLERVEGCRKLAYEYLFTQLCQPCCPYCKKVLPGRYNDLEDRDHLNDVYVPLQCPDLEINCFINDYMVQGIRLKML